MMILPKEYSFEYINIIFEEVDALCRIFEQHKAYQFLINEIDVNRMPENCLKRYYYFVGSLEIISELNPERAKYFLKLGLNEESEKDSIYQAMLTNFIGIAYLVENDLDSAKDNFDKSLEVIEELKGLGFEELEKILLIMYNCAKFYSKIENSSKAIELCNRGIDIARSKGILSHLEKLYYEKAFNLAVENKRISASENYSSAYSIAKIRNNINIIKIIKSDMEDFGLKLTI